MEKRCSIVLILCFLVFISSASVYAGGVTFDNLPQYLQWLGSNVRYQVDEGEGDWASPSTTVARGYGDCKDFAILNKEALEGLGFSAQIYVVTYSSMDKHAICVFQLNGCYAMISNSRLYISCAESWSDFEQYLFMNHGYFLPKIVL